MEQKILFNYLLLLFIVIFIDIFFCIFEVDYVCNSEPINQWNLLFPVGVKMNMNV